MQKYRRCPLSDNTVPMQFLGLILMSLGSGRVKFKIFLNQGKPEKIKTQLKYVSRKRVSNLILVELHFDGKYKSHIVLL